MNFIPYAKQSISTADIEAVAVALNAHVITRGARVEEFEQAIAAYCGSRYAVAFSSGSAALMGAFSAAKADSYDRIISSPNTFIATVGTAMQCGAKPVLVDIDASGNMDLGKLNGLMHSRRTRGKSLIVPVHFAGYPMDMKALSGMLKEQESVVIEDGCHALGSSYADGNRVGSCAYSDMTVFSFHPAKTITTGEGGMVTTNDEDLFLRLRQIRNNGIERNPQHLSSYPFEGYYEVQSLSNNYNFTEFQAALGMSQLRRIDSFVAKRYALVQEYRAHLSSVPGIELPLGVQDSLSAWNLFVVKIDFASRGLTRKDVVDKLTHAGIQTQLHYIPLYRHPVLKSLFGDVCEQFPRMEEYYAKALTLPLYADLKLSDVARITSRLKAVLKL
jgi:UDP-4-amino-4,6-dideoxy-L-N-acetyl-beta-L-altrosamine transaminase